MVLFTVSAKVTLLDTSSWSLAKIKRKHSVDICIISFANQSRSDVILCKTSLKKKVSEIVTLL